MSAFSHVYLVLTHKHKRQLFRLIVRLNYLNCIFVIHVDENEDINKFIEGIKQCSANPLIYFVKDRCRTPWGSFNLVQATLNGLNLIKDAFPGTHRITLLSGQDYPIKPSSYIHSFFNTNKNGIYISYREVQDIANEVPGVISRFPKYQTVSKMITLFKGSQWWSFPAPAMNLLLEVLTNSRDFHDYFRSVKIPDESFFQTLLLNTEDVELLSNVVNYNLRHIVWESPFVHPKIFRSEDINAIIESDALFARKFDEDIDSYILDLIDNDILQKEKSSQLLS